MNWLSKKKQIKKNEIYKGDKVPDAHTKMLVMSKTVKHEETHEGGFVKYEASRTIFGFIYLFNPYAV